MAIEKLCHDEYEILCDGSGCDVTERVDGDFMDCISFMKENSWLITKQNGEWEHYCPDCKLMR